MPRKSTLINGLVSILAGVLIFSQPALPSNAQTASPLQSPSPGATRSPSATPSPGATPSASPTSAYTPPPTFTPQPTFTPLPPTMTPTLLSPVAAPVNVPPPTLFDSILIIGGGLIVLAVLSLFWLRQRRLRRSVAERAAQPTEPVKPIAPPPPPTAALEFKDSAGSVVRFDLITPSLTLGRSGDNDLVVPDSVPEADTVSQHHAQFRRDQDDYIVRDLNSQNGLTVNGRHTNHNVLQDGDRIAFGAAEAIFRKPSGGAA